MICRRNGRVFEFFADDGETLLLRVEVPENVTFDEIEMFVRHLRKLVENDSIGPS